MMAVALQASSQPSLKLAISYAELAMTRKEWPVAAVRWQFIIDHCEGFPHQVYVRQARAWLAAQQFGAALHTVSLGLEKQPGNPVLNNLKDVIASRKAKKFQLTARRWRRRRKTNMEDLETNMELDMAVGRRSMRCASGNMKRQRRGSNAFWKNN